MTRTASFACAMAVTALALATGLAMTPQARAQAAAPNPSFNLVNKSTQAIKELFATPAGFDNWGRSRLEGKTIAAGGSFAVRLPANGNCRYDIRVVTSDGHAEDRRGVDTCNTDDVVFSGATEAAPVASPPPSPGRTTRLKLTNNGASPIQAFYIRRAGATDWGASRLGAGDATAAIAPGSALTVSVPLEGGCIYELRVVFENHQSREKRGADLCKITELPVK
jgi:hypothetical protein